MGVCRLAARMAGGEALVWVRTLLHSTACESSSLVLRIFLSGPKRCFTSKKSMLLSDRTQTGLRKLEFGAKALLLTLKAYYHQWRCYGLGLKCPLKNSRDECFVLSAVYSDVRTERVISGEATDLSEHWGLTHAKSIS